MKHCKTFFKSIYNSLGFDDAWDMITSIFVFKSKMLTLATSAVSLSLSLIMFIENYVFDPAFQYGLFIALIVASSASGSYVNVKVEGHPFDFSKFTRLFGKLVGQTLVLSFAFNMGNSNVVYGWLPNFVWIGLTGINFLRTCRNLAKMKWIEGSFADYLEKKFSDKQEEKK